MWTNNAICAERKPVLVIHKLIYLQSCASTAFLCRFGLLNVEGVACSKGSRSTLKYVVLGAINISVFIFPTATKIITYRWNNEFASQIIVFISDDFYYLHSSDCSGSPKITETDSFSCFGYSPVKLSDDSSRLIMQVKKQWTRKSWFQYEYKYIPAL